MKSDTAFVNKFSRLGLQKYGILDEDGCIIEPLHWRNRILRVEEVMRLQTGWKLTGNIESQWREVGNAVPPPLALQLGEAS